MSLKRFGREVALAAGLLVAGERSAAAESAKPTEVVKIGKTIDKSAEIHFSQKVNDFKKEVIKILSLLETFPEEAAVLVNTELDKRLQAAPDKSEMSQLAIIDKFAKDWLQATKKVNRDQRQTKDGADLEAGHAAAMEHQKIIGEKLRDFFNPKIPDAQAMQILRDIVPAGSNVNYGKLQFRRDAGSDDIFLNSKKVDSVTRPGFIKEFGK
ncbi:MAG: hypothetical protein Q7S66_01320 [bacterium]|nr:hypothetical protein [bacterium]